jgi:hypothetical protein
VPGLPARRLSFARRLKQWCETSTKMGRYSTTVVGEVEMLVGAGDSKRAFHGAATPRCLTRPMAGSSQQRTARTIWIARYIGLHPLHSFRNQRPSLILPFSCSLQRSPPFGSPPTERAPPKVATDWLDCLFLPFKLQLALGGIALCNITGSLHLLRNRYPWTNFHCTLAVIAI